MNEIEACIDFLETKDAVYLAKEDIIIYYGSITGSIKDEFWQQLTLAEARRIISYTVKEVREKHLISALQELGAIYSMGVISDYTVPQGIFNLRINKGTQKEELLVRSFLSALEDNEVINITAGQYQSILRGLADEYGIKSTAQSRARLIRNLCDTAGYTLFEGKERKMVNRSKCACLVVSGYTGKLDRIDNKSYRQIKDLTKRGYTNG